MKYKNGEKFYRICASNGKVSELSVELVYKINGVTGGEGKYKNEEQFEKFIKENSGYSLPKGLEHPLNFFISLHFTPCFQSRRGAFSSLLLP